MKKLLILLFSGLFSGVLLAQTFPVQNLQVNGSANFSGNANFASTSSFTGQSSFSVRPLFAGNTPYDTGNLPSVLGSYAPLTSPGLNGTPQTPTAPVGTNTTQIASTAFVVSHDPCPSILDYGGNNTGAGSNNAAFSTAISASPTGQACVYFPAGSYAFAATAAFTFPSNVASITIEGAGAESTQLLWGSTTGIQINYIGPLNSAHIRDLAVLTTGTPAGNGILLNQTAASSLNPANSALSDVTNVTVRGADTYVGVDYWTIGVDVVGVSNINFIGVMVVGKNISPPQGIGVQVAGTALLPPVVFNLTDCTLNNLQFGFVYGNYVQGVTISQSNFTFDTTGVFVPGSLTGLDQLVITASQFGMPSSASTGVSLNSWVPFTMISNNLFFVNGTDSGVFGMSGLLTVTGNTFHGNGAAANGVVINSTNAGNASIIAGNVFNGLGSGVFLQAGSSLVNVQSNAYSSNTANVTNSGTGNTIGGGSP